MPTTPASVTTQFRPYLRLHNETVERTIRRMKLPLPKGVVEPSRGIRFCLLADKQLRGTITNEVLKEFAEGTRLEAFDPEKAHGWVVVVTRRCARDCARTRARQLARQASLHHEDGSFLDHLVPCYDTPEARLFGAEGQKRAWGLLAKLRDADQELVRARVLDETPYEELAFTFGSTPVVLRKRFERLMIKLRRDADELARLDLCA